MDAIQRHIRFSKFTEAYLKNNVLAVRMKVNEYGMGKNTKNIAFSICLLNKKIHE